MPPGLSDPPATATGHPWYPPPPGGYDEAHDPAGHPRPHWAPFFRALDDLGPAELARRWRDAQFRVLGDRTQAPSGAGYALENRIVMTRTLPEAFRDCRVHRLALFFRAL